MEVENYEISFYYSRGGLVESLDIVKTLNIFDKELIYSLLEGEHQLDTDLRLKLIETTPKSHIYSMDQHNCLIKKLYFVFDAVGLVFYAEKRVHYGRVVTLRVCNFSLEFEDHIKVISRVLWNESDQVNNFPFVMLEVGKFINPKKINVIGDMIFQ